MSALSEREKQILDCITDCYKEKGYSPSVRDIQRQIGIRSTATVYSYIEKLVEKGYLKKDANKSRSLRPDVGAPTYRVPLLGKVTAGAPILAVESHEETVSFCTDGRRFAPGELFALRVSGKSMIEAGIMDGDIVVVLRTPTASNGEIVVALIDDEATVKTFYKEKGRFRLQPENREYEPIYTDHVRILGRVVASLRYYP